VEEKNGSKRYDRQPSWQTLTVRGIF